MSDRELRELERAFRETGDVAARDAWLQARARIGDPLQLELKLVYVGLPKVGKTANFEVLVANAPGVFSSVEPLTSKAIEGDRSLWFSADASECGGSVSVRYTVATCPGACYYPETMWPAVFAGVHGAVFVSDPFTRFEYLEDMRLLLEHAGLLTQGTLADLPLVLQINKQDIAEQMTHAANEPPPAPPGLLARLRERLGLPRHFFTERLEPIDEAALCALLGHPPAFRATATTGEGVWETFAAIRERACARAVAQACGVAI